MLFAYLPSLCFGWLSIIAFLENRSHSTSITPSQSHHGAYPAHRPTSFSPTKNTTIERGRSGEAVKSFQLSHAPIMSTSERSVLARAGPRKRGPTSPRIGVVGGWALRSESTTTGTPYLTSNLRHLLYMYLYSLRLQYRYSQDGRDTHAIHKGCVVLYVAVHLCDTDNSYTFILNHPRLPRRLS